MRMNQKTAFSDAQPQPLASSSPNRARPRVCVVPGCRACCAIVLHPSGVGARLAPSSRRCYLTSRVPFIVVGWTWQRNVYVARLERRDRVLACFGPVKNAVSPIATAAPLESWITTLCWSRRVLVVELRVKAVSALASSVVGSKPVVAAPLGAVTVTTGAFGSIDARRRRRAAAAAAGQRVQVAVRDTASRPGPACSSDRASR